MKKKVLVLFLLLGLAVTGVTGGVAPATGEPQVMELSLRQAVELALKHNPQTELNRLSILKAKVALDEAKSTAKKMEDAEDFLGATYETAQARYVAPRAAEMGVKLAELGGTFQENLLKFNVESSYYGVLKAEAGLANARASLDRAREQLRLAQAGYEAGTLAKAEVMGAQVLVAAAEAEVTAAVNAREVALMKLNKALGQDLQQQVRVTDRFAFQPAEFKLEEVLAATRENDPGLAAAMEQVAVQEVKFAQAKRFYTPNVYAYRNAEYDLEEARVKLAGKERDLEFSVRQASLNLQAAAEAYRVLEQNVEVARENLRVANLKLEAGVGTRIEAQRAAEDLQKMEANMLGAIYDYNLAKAMLQYRIFAGGDQSASGQTSAGTGDGSW